MLAFLAFVGEELWMKESASFTSSLEVPTANYENSMVLLKAPVGFPHPATNGSTINLSCTIRLFRFTFSQLFELSGFRNKRSAHAKGQRASLAIPTRNTQLKKRTFLISLDTTNTFSSKRGDSCGTLCTAGSV